MKLKEKAIIFDLDGVIVDTAKYHYLAWNRLANELGFEFSETDNEQLKGVSRMDSLEILLKIGKLTDLSYQNKMELADRKNGYYLDLIRDVDSKEILPQIYPLLKSLKASKYKIALGSASKSAQIILKKLKIETMFDAIVDGNTIEKAKPDPEVFLMAAKLLMVPNEECIVIEDAAAGIEAAKAAGMKSIGIGNKDVLKYADIVVENTEALWRLWLQELKM